MKSKQLVALLVTFIALLSGSVSTFATSLPRIDLLGDAIPVSAATRIIVITPNTKYVNVTGGENVRFVAGDKSFAWNFDGALQISSFDLNRTAPANVLDHRIIAYVSPNPLYVP